MAQFQAYGSGCSPRDLVNKLVAIERDRNPRWFGPNRPLPNKFVLTACALSSCANAIREPQKSAQPFAMMRGFGVVLKEVDV